MDGVRAAKRFLELAGEVPGLLEAAVEQADRITSIGRRGERAYERTHGGKTREPFDLSGGGTRFVAGFPDPRTGVTEMGRLVSIGYVADKGEGGTILYQHEFGPRARSEQCPECGNHVRASGIDPRTLPVLGFTMAEHPSGLVICRDRSRYTVTKHGIEG